jgi:hypothetical protein
MAVRIKGRDTVSPDDGWLEMKEYFELGLELRKPFEQQWLVNLAFLSGKQYSFYNTGVQLLQQVAARKGRIKVIDNKILPRYRKQVSRLIRNRAEMSCVPSTNEDEDIESAKIGTKVLKGFWRSDGLQGKLRTLAGWVYSCGNAYLVDRWDPRRGPVKLNEKAELVYQGDVTCDVYSPLEVLVPAYGLSDGNIHSFPWLIIAKVRNIEYFSSTYGKKGELVTPETGVTSRLNMSMIPGLATMPSGTHKTDSAIEIRLFIKPCSKYPKGVYKIGANGRILVEDDFPFDSYSIEQFKDIEIPGVFHGMATIEPAIWLQKIWNSTLSDIVEFNRTMGRGKWLVPRNANLQQNPDDSFGQILTYTPQMGIKPEHVTIKGLPSSYQQILMHIAQEFMELYNQHEVTQGTNKSDIRSGEMVQLLLEQDDHGNIPTHAVFEESLEACMRRVLRRIQKGYTDERMIQISGKGEEYEVFSFKGSDLRNNTDVMVKKESSLPDSRVGRQAKVMERYREGLYGDPRDPKVQRKIQLMLDDAVTDDIYGDSYRDEQIANKENKLLMSKPQVLRINSYDNHEVHIPSHNRAQKSPDHQALKGHPDPNQQRLFFHREMAFTQHNAQHSKMLDMMKRKQLQEMMMAQGGGK